MEEIAEMIILSNEQKRYIIEQCCNCIETHNIEEYAMTIGAVLAIIELAKEYDDDSEISESSADQ